MAKKVKFPTYQNAAGEGKLFGRYLLSFPMSLVKDNGVWRAVQTPSQDELSVAEKWYLGGYTYLLTDEEAADLPPQYVEDA
jgi:hypothetical protein